MERVGEEKKIAWEFAPVGSPHVNGQAERAIRAMKKSMSGVALSKRISYGEFAALVSEIRSIMNSRPYEEQDCMEDRLSTEPWAGVKPESLVWKVGNQRRLQGSNYPGESSQHQTFGHLFLEEV